MLTSPQYTNSIKTAISFAMSMILILPGGTRGAEPEGTTLDVNCAPRNRSLMLEFSRGIALVDLGDTSCSGTLISDNMEGNPSPYLVTAAHCVDTQAEAERASIIFDFLSESCGSDPPLPATLERIGADLVFTTGSLRGGDLSVLRLKRIPQGRRFYFGLDINKFLEIRTARLHGLAADLGREVTDPGVGVSYFYGVDRGFAVKNCGFDLLSYVEIKSFDGFIADGNSGGAVITEDGYFQASVSGLCPLDREWQEYSILVSGGRPYGRMLQSLGINSSKPTSIRTIHSDGFETGSTSEWNFAEEP